ncbi:MAG: hypothetical protein PHE79_12285 [Eubacteriales bacterium]|nr:hypothetical protein [Eubacteriales bacterium]
MEKTKRLLLAIGDDAMEAEIRTIKEAEIIDSDQDVGIITDILNYETADFVIVNTVLSEEKSLDLAKKAKEKSAKVIAIIGSHKNKEFVAALVGFGVRAFVRFDEIKKIPGIIRNYPEEFDFTKFENRSSDSRGRTAGIQGKLFGKGSGTKIKTVTATMSGSRIIGIISAFPGAGATSLCVGLTSHLCSQGSVLLLDRTDNKNLSGIKIKGQDILDRPLSAVNIAEYDFIIIDFGRLVDIGADGKVMLKEDMKNEKRLERQFCQEMILVGSSLPWKLPELTQYFTHPVFENMTGNWVFYINGEQNKVFEELRKSYEERRSFFVSYESTDPYADLYEYIKNRRKEHHVWQT